MATSCDILTERLRITTFSEVHLTSRYVAWLNDPEVVRFSEQRHRRHTLESCREYMTSFNDSPNFFWAIEETEANLGHIGNINAYVDLNNLIGDVGILIGEKSAQGKGYGAEAFQAVCSWLLREGKMRKVTAGAISANEPMLRLMRRTGMREDGCRLRHHILDGQEVNIVHMALFKEDLV